MMLAIAFLFITILFVVLWYSTNEVEHQITAAMFMILMYVQINSVDLNVVKETNETILEGVMLIIDQNELTQDIIDLQPPTKGKNELKYHSA